MEYISKTFKFDEEVLGAVEKLPISLNQFLRKILTADGVFETSAKVVRKQSQKQKVVEELAASDLTAQVVGRDDIEYGDHTELPRGEHVANLRTFKAPLLKPKEKK